MVTSTYRETVALVAAKAKEKLPECNGRVESATKLVLAHDVLFREDGTVEVGSASDPLKTYTVAGQACDCQDFAYGKAPSGWCQHRLAAAIATRVQQLVPVVPEIEPWPDNDPEEPASPVEMAPAPTPAVPLLPEAPASANCYITIAGRQVQLTLRDTDEARLLERLAAVLAEYPLPEKPTQGQPQGQLSPQQHNAAAMQRPVSGFCPVHHVQMAWNDGREGRKGWYSHRTADGWCKGR